METLLSEITQSFNDYQNALSQMTDFKESLETQVINYCKENFVGKIFINAQTRMAFPPLTADYIEDVKAVKKFVRSEGYAGDTIDVVFIARTVYLTMNTAREKYDYRTAFSTDEVFLISLRTGGIANKEVMTTTEFSDKYQLFDTDINGYNIRFMSRVSMASNNIHSKETGIVCRRVCDNYSTKIFIEKDDRSGEITKLAHQVELVIE